MNTSLGKIRFFTILCFIASITAFHHGTPHRLMYLHVFLQALFFVPVSLSGWWFGKKGGLLAAILVFLVYIHHAVTVMMPTAEMMVANGVQIILFFLAGAFIGTYTDTRISYQNAVHGGKTYPPAIFPMEQKLLVYLDNSGASMNAIRYIAHLFKNAPDVRVTLLKVINPPREEFLALTEQQSEEQMESDVAGSTGIAEEARSLLLKSGIPEENISCRFVRRDNARISDVLLAEQKSREYSAIVVGRHRLSRSEEFLFGSVAIRLARQANCPVWVIGDSSASPISSAADRTPESANQTDEAFVTKQTTGVAFM
jgi:nucleotide-binding universal stress UspA family protein